jgi:hypothetical protein
MLTVIVWIFWVIGYFIFFLSAIHLPRKFQRPMNEFDKRAHGKPEIISYFAWIYWCSVVCIFWFLGTLIHPAIFWFHVICIGICIFLFVFINGREHYKTTQIKKEQRREEERRKKLDAFTKGCTKKAIVWGFIGSIAYGADGVSRVARRKTVPTNWGWHFQDGPRPSSYGIPSFQGPEGLIPTAKQFNLAEQKRNRQIRQKRRSGGFYPVVEFTVEELEKEERIYDAMIRRKQKIEENKEV